MCAAGHSRAYETGLAEITLLGEHMSDESEGERDG